MQALIAEHRDFTERVLEAGRRALGGIEVWPWLESQADRVAMLGRQRSHIALNSRLRSELRAGDVRRHEYHELESHGKRKGWTGSIRPSDQRHDVAIIRANGLQHIRALEAHEFGHALLQRDPHFWHAISDRALMADRGIERLVDDAARLLLLPPSLLDRLTDLTCDSKGESEEARRLAIWSLLPTISQAAIVPVRLVASRLASVLVEHRAILLCYALPRQRSLFDRPRQTTGKVTASISWMMIYQRHHEACRRYLFADRLGPARKIVLSGDQLAQASEREAKCLDTDLARRLAGRRGWECLGGSAQSWRIGSALTGDQEQHFVLFVAG